MTPLRTLRNSTCILLLLVAAAGMALAQSVTLTPPSLTFSAQSIGTTSPGKTVTLKNTSGSTALAITSITASGDYLTTSCPASIPPGGTCVLTINFAPNAVGTINGAVTIVDNATPNAQVVNLTGTAVGPVTFAPATVSFPATAIGSTSGPKTVTVTNLQSVSLSFTAVTASGDYAISTDTCVGSIGANVTCTINLTFTPTVKGTVPGVLTVTDSAADSPEVVSLSGSGTGTVTNPVSFAPASLTFANQLKGSTSAGKTITLTNHGTTNLTVTGVTASGDYSETDTCTGQSIAVNGTCIITVKFTPTTTGAIKGVISAADSAVTSQQVVSLTGSGVGTLSFSPATLAFNIQDLNLTGTPLNATLTNNSTAAVTISNIAISGLYTQTNTCGSSIAAHSDCTFSVTYAPKLVGTTNGAVTVTDSAAGSPQVLSLTATATNPARFAYAFGNGLLGYTFNPVSGQLRANGVAPLSGYAMVALAVHPSGKFIYGPADNNGNAVNGFSLNATTGVATLIAGSPFSTSGIDPRNLTFVPSGKFLYVSDDASSDIAGFSVNTSTGMLTPITGSPFPSLGSLPEGLMTDTLGKFLYTADDGGTVSGYSINATTGALTALPGFPVSTPAGNSSLAMTPSGKFLYVAPFNSSTGINAFSINATTGALTPVPGSPFGAGVNSENTGGFAVDPTGRFLYKANIIDAGSGDNISAFSIASNGALTQIAGSPFSTPREPSSVTIDPTGKFVYVADLGSNHLQSFAINQATGSLTPLENVDTGTDPFAMAFVTGANPVVYTPTFAYAVNLTDKTVSQYTINPTTGGLTSIGSALGDTNGPQAMAAIPGGKFIFAGDTNSKLSGYKVNATTGALSKIVGSPFSLSGLNNPVALTSFISAVGFGTLLCTANAGDNTLSVYIIDPTSGIPSVLFTGIAGGVGPHAMAATPLGTYAFVVNSSDNSLWSYDACSSPVTNLSTGLPGFPTGASPMAVTVDPGGQYVYVANSGDNSVSAYKIAEGNDGSALAGAPVPITGSPYSAGTGPVAALVEPLGRYLYVANGGGSTISAYSIAPTTGALIAITGTFNTGSSPDSMSTSNDGKFLYATNKSAGTVSIFTINADGTLTSAGTATTGTAPASILTLGTIK